MEHVIPAVILAAGLSSRMGRPKALLPIEGGDTFLTRIVRTFREAGVPEIVVVLGHGADAIIRSLGQQALDVRAVVNASYESGQLSSILSGLDAVDRPAVRAMLLTLVDVPLVSAATVRAVIDRYRRTGAPVVRPVQSDRHGHPVLIDRSLFGALRSADPDRGAKPLVRQFASPEGDLPCDDEGAFVDVDTPDEYAAVFGRALPEG
jgi:molybdenum cofactor cytidylyltransferase